MRNDCFAEGAAAARGGKPQHANPYDPSTDVDSFTSWHAGWRSVAEADEAEADF